MDWGLIATIASTAAIALRSWLSWCGRHYSIEAVRRSTQAVSTALSAARAEGAAGAALAVARNGGSTLRPGVVITSLAWDARPAALQARWGDERIDGDHLDTLCSAADRLVECAPAALGDHLADVVSVYGRYLCVARVGRTRTVRLLHWFVPWPATRWWYVVTIWPEATNASSRAATLDLAAAVRQAGIR